MAIPISEVTEGVKGSELPAATVLVRDEKFLVVQQGVTKALPLTLLNELLTQGSYIDGTFTENDVVDGILTLNHGLNTDKVVVFITNPAGENQWVPWKKADSNTITINFGGPPDTGTSTFIILYWLAGSEFNEAKKFKTISIASWTLNYETNKSIVHGLPDWKKIKSVKCTIYNDDDDHAWDFLSISNHFNFEGIPAGGATTKGSIDWDASYVHLRLPSTAQWYHEASPQQFASVNITRGFIEIEYTD